MPFDGATFEKPLPVGPTFNAVALKRIDEVPEVVDRRRLEEKRNMKRLIDELRRPQPDFYYWSHSTCAIGIAERMGIGNGTAQSVGSAIGLSGKDAARIFLLAPRRPWRFWSLLPNAKDIAWALDRTRDKTC